MRIEDEFGVQWHIESGDKARMHFNVLKRSGFDWIVLPRYTLITGQVVDDVGMHEFFRDVRLRECVGRLHEVGA